MRRRILFSTLLVSITAIVVLGVPLGFAFSGLIRSEQLRQLDREAGTLAATLENEQRAGRPITPALVNQFAGPDRYAQVSRRTSTGDEVVAAGQRPSGPQLRSVVATSDDVQVQLTLGAENLERRTRLVWALVGGLSVAGVVASIAVGVVLARRLAAPLDDLAATSRRLGGGDFSARTSAHGVAEVDAVAEALNHSAERIGYLLATERQFSVDASHQLRTPLTALRMRLEELAVTDDLGVVREETAAAMAQTDRLTATITELLDLRRLGRVGDEQELDLAAAVDRHSTLWGNNFRRAGRRLEVVTCGPEIVRASPGAIGQTLDVLLDNALRHGSGTVLIQVGPPGPAGSVRVSDEGQGIQHDQNKHLFVRAPDHIGSGVGLALARALVESEGGRLELVQARPALFQAVFRVR